MSERTDRIRKALIEAKDGIGEISDPTAQYIHILLNMASSPNPDMSLVAEALDDAGTAPSKLRLARALIVRFQS